MHNSQLALTIKTLCSQNHVSISKMLSDCELSKSFIYDLEKRSKTPSCETLERIADYFNTSIDCLLGRTVVYDSVNKKTLTLFDLPYKELANQPEPTPEIINSLSKLNLLGKHQVLTYINGLLENSLFTLHNSEMFERIAANERVSKPAVKNKSARKS